MSIAYDDPVTPQAQVLDVGLAPANLLLQPAAKDAASLPTPALAVNTPAEWFSSEGYITQSVHRLAFARKAVNLSRGQVGAVPRNPVRAVWGPPLTVAGLEAMVKDIMASGTGSRAEAVATMDTSFRWVYGLYSRWRRLVWVAPEVTTLAAVHFILAKASPQSISRADEFLLGICRPDRSCQMDPSYAVTKSRDRMNDRIYTYLSGQLRATVTAAEDGRRLRQTASGELYRPRLSSLAVLEMAGHMVELWNSEVECHAFKPQYDPRHDEFPTAVRV